ncbi:MAG: HK97 family phage prohead protease [Rhodospirillales bacterium]|nr:HK97 family phage prohead protease [Rhodospirillales bacterium]
MPAPMSTRAFAVAARTDGVPKDTVVRQAFAVEIAPQAGREIAFTLSTGDEDRSGDIVDPRGWRLDAYRRNPVVLWAHDTRQLPIGRAVDIALEDGRLRAVAEFATADLNPQGERVYRMLREGYLSAVSVGFIPLEWDWADGEARAGGIDFKAMDLTEFSVVPVPANPNSLIETRGVPADEDAIAGWARDVLGVTAGDMIVPARRLERLEKAHAELVARKAAEMVAPPPPPRLPRITEAYARLASLGRR